MNFWRVVSHLFKSFLLFSSAFMLTSADICLVSPDEPEGRTAFFSILAGVMFVWLYWCMRSRLYISLLIDKYKPWLPHQDYFNKAALRLARIEALFLINVSPICIALGVSVALEDTPALFWDSVMKFTLLPMIAALLDVYTVSSYEEHQRWLKRLPHGKWPWPWPPTRRQDV